MVQLVSTKIELTPAEREQLLDAVTRDAPWFAARLSGAVDVARVEQTWFPGHRILEVSSAVPPPAWRVHVAAGAGGMKILSGHLEHLHAVCDGDPVQEALGEEERAAAYGKEVHAWTNLAPLGELVVSSFDDIPWFGYLSEPMKATIAQLRVELGEKIVEPQRRHTGDAWAFRTFVVAKKQLIERVIYVPPDGKLQRDDHVHASEIPVPPGARWGFKDGRLVPVG